MKNKVILSLLTVILSINLFIVPAYAEGTNIYSWVYGTYTSDYSGPLDNIAQVGTLNIPFGDGVIPIPIAKTHAYQEISVTMSGYMSGTVIMSVSPLTSLQWADLYISGGSIDSWNYTTGVLNLRINGTDHFTVTFLNRSTFTSWLNQALSISLTGSLTNVGSPAYNLNEIDIKLATTNNNLSNILSAINDIDSYQDDYLSMLEDIETYTEYLSLLDDIETYTEYLPTISSNIESVITNLTSGFNTVTQKLNSINESLNALNIPLYSQSFFRILSANNTSNIGNNLYGSYVNNTSGTNYNFYTFDSGYKYYMIYGVPTSATTSALPQSSSAVTITEYSRIRTNYLTYFVVLIEPSSAGQKVISFNFNNNIYPIYWGFTYNVPSELMFLFRSGQYSDEYIRKLNDIKNAIQNINLNVDNLTVTTNGVTYNVDSTDVNSSITTYNTDINTVYNVENNLSYQFDSYIEDINLDVSPLLEFNNSSTYMNSIIEDLGTIKFISYPIGIYLIGIVLIALLG